MLTLPSSSDGCPFNKQLYGEFKGISVPPFQPVCLNKNGKKLNLHGLHKILKEILQKLVCRFNGSHSIARIASTVSSLKSTFSSPLFHESDVEIRSLISA
jgi:hypothetical protein